MQNWPSDVNVIHLYNGESLTVIIVEGGQSNYYNIDKNSSSFNKAMQALKYKDLPSLMIALSPIQVAKHTGISGLEVVEGVVYYNGEELHSALTTKIFEFYNEGHDYKPLQNFLENLMQNPSKTAIDELYLFIQSSTTPMPITEDGHFLAYKKVRHDMKDLYTGTVDYSVGNVVAMPRGKVSDDRQVTCAEGLHFCSLSYLPSYYGGEYPVVLVKINPADVVSIPHDYNNAKGRTCRMEVIGMHSKSNHEPAWDKALYKEEAAAEKLDATVEVRRNTDGIKFFDTRAQARKYAHNNGGTVRDADRHPLRSALTRWYVVPFS